MYSSSRVEARGSANISLNLFIKDVRYTTYTAEEARCVTDATHQTGPLGTKPGWVEEEV